MSGARASRLRARRHGIPPLVPACWRPPPGNGVARIAITWIFIVFALSPGTVRGDGVSCPADRRDERVVSAQVFDGDTLALSDGRKVRMLGINTPEIGRDGEPSEPYAVQARAMLEAIAGPGARLSLRLDTERYDRYGRLLAHVFSDDGSNLQALLLSAGYATTLVVPPNEWSLDCYAGLERQARAMRAGIWSHGRYQPVPAATLADSARGFHLVTGRVQRVGESRGNWWLNLTPDVAIRIPKDDLIYFATLNPRALAGRRLEARGWITRRRGELRMTVRHPAALTILD